ncbi:DNA internalization-related competence protein ComEC/Rec2 [Anaerotignum sp.]
MRRPALWATIFTICGIYMRLGISEMMCLVSFLLMAVSMLYFVTKDKNGRYLFLLLFAAFGFLSAGYHWEGNPDESIPEGMVQGEGVIKNTGLTASGNQKLTLLCDLEDERGTAFQDVKLYALWWGEERFETGERVSFSGELVPFYTPSYPGGYDEALFLTTKGFEYKVYLDRIEHLEKDISVSSALARGRARFRAVLDSILPAEESGIMKAILTGEKDDIPDDSYKLYTEAGVVHVLCISGLHMSVLAMYLSFFMEKILGRSRRVSAAVTILAVLSFLLFIEPSPSSVRAAAMICIVMVGRICFRLSDRMNTIALAALLILSIQPLYLFHIGFQLSFITVMGICLGVSKLEKKKKKDRGRFHWLKESFLVSLYASLFSFPVVAYHFYSVSLVGILANLIIVPLSGLLLGFGMLSGVLGLFSLPAGVFAAGSVYGILQIFQGVCSALIRLPFAYTLVGRPSLLVILLYYGILLWFMEFGGKKGSWKVGVVLCGAMFCAVFENAIFRKETTIAFLNVGQGDAAVISAYDGKTYLIDGGGVYGKEMGKNVGRNVVLPYLESLGVSRLDGVFLSHPDSDHMTGLLEVLEKIPTKGLYLSDYPFSETEDVLLLKEMVEKNNVPLYTVKVGDGSDGFCCLYPLEGVTFRDGDDNHGSMVLKYGCNGTEILFAGDISAADERFLLEQEADVSADILKVAHHGSKYSSDADFLEVVSPKAAVISCGAGNLYGHPHGETLERLQSAEAEIYRTDTEGAILVKLKRDGTFAIETMTERKPFYENVKEKLEKP